MKTDFNIGNLVYILFLVIVIVNAFRKKKKPAQQVQPRVDSEVPENPLLVEDILETKLKAFFGEFNQPTAESIPAPAIEEGYYTEEILDVPKSSEPVYAAANVFSPETKLDDYKSPFDINEGILDTIGKEEGIPNWNYAEEIHITDEIKLSEGKELESVDYNPEMEELIANFDARRAFIYSEIFSRKEFGYK